MKKQIFSNKIVKKVVAGAIAFNLMFANTSLIGVNLISYATDSIEDQSINVIKTDIEFNAYFKQNDNDVRSYTGDVNQQANMYIYLNAKTGYLKNATIQFIDEQNNELNYQIGTNVKSNIIQNVNNNVITLQQIDSESEKIIEIPLIIKKNKYMQTSDISKNIKAILKGTYINNEGKEINVEKEMLVNISLDMNFETAIEEKVLKYINLGNKVLVQEEITVEAKTQGENKLPVAETKVNITVPTYKGQTAEKVDVTAKALLNTSGEEEGKTTFSSENWVYNIEENIITIAVQNKATIKGLYNEKGKDTFIVTYVYSNDTEEVTTTINSNVYAEIKLCNSKTNSQKIQNEINLTEFMGTIVNYNNSITSEMSKGKIYANTLSQNAQYVSAYNTKWSIEVADTEKVEELYVKDDGEKLVTVTEKHNLNVKYTQTKINKVNFEQILGIEGNVKILNVLGEEIANINKDSEQDTDGNYIFNYTQEIGLIDIKTSKPVNIGSLVIEHKKEILPTQLITKQIVQESQNIVSEIFGKATYIENMLMAEEENIVATMQLKETSTKAELYIEPKTLSTIVKNENVTLRIQLNDEVETSDLYINPTFNIYLPNSIEAIDIKEGSILYNDELSIEKVELINIEGRNVIAITVKGQSTKFSTGTVAKGTNIILKTDITVKSLTPNKTEEFEMYYTNQNAVQYNNAQSDIGYDYKEVELSAPLGLVNISTISGFDEVGSSVTSINQGEKLATIKILDNAKSATMKLTIMNNNSNTCSNVAIVGKIPFKGNTELTTGQDLGTTVNTILTSYITPLNIPVENVTIYYSENGNIDQDVNNPNNGWTTTPEDITKMKAYLIKLNDYELQVGQIIEFAYNFQIPENLEHNAYLFGTFGTLYQNNKPYGTINELSIADKVGLTTGTGPEIDFELTNNVVEGSPVMQYQNIRYTIKIKNKGSNIAENIVTKFYMPQNTSFVKTFNENEKYEVANQELIWKTDVLQAEETRKLQFEIKANIPTEEIIESKAVLTAKDLATELQAQAVPYKVEETPFVINISADYNETYKLKEDVAMNIYATVRNNTDETKNNVIIKTYIPEGLIFVKAYKSEYNTQKQESEYVELNAQYDEDTRVLTYIVPTLENMKSINMKLEVLTGYLKEEETLKQLVTKVSAQADNTQTVYSNDLVNVVARAKLDINLTSDITNTFIKEEDIFKYILNITNNGEMSATKVMIEGQIPEELEIESITYTSLGTVRNVTKPQNNNISFNIGTLAKGTTTEVVIQTKAKRLSEGVTEKDISNSFLVSADNIAKKQTNTINHTIEINENLVSQPETENNNPSSIKKYTINGLVWLDANNDGTREENEVSLSNISVNLINNKNEIISRTNTNEKGEYEFSNLDKGNYFVMFEYDNSIYKVTEYKKEAVKDNINSDAFETEIKQNGISSIVAITDVITIEDVSYSNIDLGLANTEHFNLSLRKSVTSITLQNKEGTNTYNYDKSDLAKIEIAGKKLAGSTVIIEYIIEVKNEGTIAGTANNIVDYMPTGTSFSSELNPNWYLGQDNSLYNQSLKNVVINPGETKEVKLILTKKMTENNTGIVNNKAEIFEAYNEKGLKDVDSTPANKVQGENDLDYADALISVRTGERSLYISLVFIIAIIIGLGLRATDKSINKKQWEGIE